MKMVSRKRTIWNGHKTKATLAAKKPAYIQIWMRHYDDSNALLVTKMKDEMSGFTIEELAGSRFLLTQFHWSIQVNVREQSCKVLFLKWIKMNINMFCQIKNA